MRASVLASWVLLIGVAACNSVLGIEEAELAPGSTGGGGTSGVGGGAGTGGAGTEYCNEDCRWSNDGACDDGGPGSTMSVCDYGTDCGDCGPREAPPPDPALIGTECSLDSECPELPEGFCAWDLACSVNCVTHTDCGCPDGTTNADLGEGACAAACINQSGGSAACIRVCTNDGECGAGTFCDEWDWYSTCEPFRSIGGSCAAESACSDIPSGECLDSGICSIQCSTHTDCGCDGDPSNADIAAGGCDYGCVTTTNPEGAECYSTCSDDSDCYGGTYCLQGSDFQFCYREAAVGNPCVSNHQCGSDPTATCLDEGLCATECTTHTDCGCPTGTTNDDLLADGCDYACITPSGESTGWCRRYCDTDADCYRHSTCTAGDPLGYCSAE